MGCAGGKKYEEPVSPPGKKSADAPDLEKRPSRVQFDKSVEVIIEPAKGHAADASHVKDVEKVAHAEKTHGADGSAPKRKNVTAMVKASDLPPDDDDDEDEEDGAAADAAPAATSIVPTPAAAPKKPADPNAHVKIADEATVVRQTEVDRAVNGEEGEEAADETPKDAGPPKKKRAPTACGVKLGAFNMDDDDDEDEDEEGAADWPAEGAVEDKPVDEGAGPDVADGEHT